MVRRAHIQLSSRSNLSKVFLCNVTVAINVTPLSAVVESSPCYAVVEILEGLEWRFLPIALAMMHAKIPHTAPSEDVEDVFAAIVHLSVSFIAACQAVPT